MQLITIKRHTMRELTERIRFTINTALKDRQAYVERTQWLVPEHRERALQNLQEAQQWFTSLPNPPVPNWDDAPRDATFHAFSPSGIGLWFWAWGGKIDEVEPNPTASGGWHNTVMCGASGLELPIGIDWRTTLAVRPTDTVEKDVADDQ